MTYLFYDLETTGLNPSFDQILQFAAIRTDADLKEISRHEILLKLRDDVIPSPYGMIAHNISPEKATEAYCEYDAIREIHALLNEPETISLGYNTLKFDDEFLRFSFYRNLLPPYTHQYANNCGRMDIMPMLALYWLFRPEIIEWPKIDGKISLKLELLKEKNKLASGVSHDAMVDVEATVALAKRLQSDEEMWRHASDCFHKITDRKRWNDLRPFSEKILKNFKFGLLSKVSYGSERDFLAPVLLIGFSDVYKNQMLLLRLDRPELRETTIDNIPETTWIERKKMGEPAILLPPSKKMLERMGAERLEIMQNNKEWLEANGQLLNEIVSYYINFSYPRIPEVDVDTLLYQTSFYSDQERKICDAFHRQDLVGKTELIETMIRPDMRELAARILFRNFGDELNDLPEYLQTEQEQYRYSINPVFSEEAALDFKGNKKLTPQMALEQIVKLKKERELTQKQKTVIRNLEKRLKNFK